MGWESFEEAAANKVKDDKNGPAEVDPFKALAVDSLADGEAAES